jgi:hypothetical protein
VNLDHFWKQKFFDSSKNLTQVPAVILQTLVSKDQGPHELSQELREEHSRKGGLLVAKNYNYFLLCCHLKLLPVLF